MPMLTASPISWMESEIMATLLVKTPPKNSNTEKARFNRKAIRMFRSLFKILLLCFVVDVLHGNIKNFKHVVIV